MDKARLIAKIAHENKGENIVLMDMRGVSTMCDWFVLVSATSSRRIKSIASTIQKELSETRVRPLSVEGRENPYWVLLDYEDVVVHIFHEQIRDFYAIDRLWSEAPKERYIKDA